MSAPAPAISTIDDRLKQRSLLKRLLALPELGAVAGAVVVFAFFAVTAGASGFLSITGTANYLAVAAELGILAVPVSMLMIAGEFDLSVGSMIAASGMVIALLAGQYQFPLAFALAVAALFAALVGFLNGLVVVWTRLPSFIVTLGSFFILAGVTIGVTRLLTGLTTIGKINTTPDFQTLQPIFGGRIGPFSVSILFWLGIAAIGTWVLLRTRFGNWIFGTGGNAEAARNLGVPANAVKITMFVCTALAAWLVAAIDAVSLGNSDVLRGTGREFEAIIAAVIGGTLLTGGYGSAIGPLFGALIFGMVQQGIVFAGVDSDWYKAFLGAMLILAVLVNNYIRRSLAGAK